MKTKITLTILIGLFLSFSSLSEVRNPAIFKIGINNISYQTGFYINNSNFLCTTAHGVLDSNIMDVNALKIDIFNYNKERITLNDPDIFIDYDKDLMLITINPDRLGISKGLTPAKDNHLEKLHVIGWHGNSLLQSDELLGFHQITRLGDDMNDVSFTIPNPDTEALFLSGIIVEGFSGAPVFRNDSVFGYVSGSNYTNKLFAIPIASALPLNPKFKKFRDYKNEIYKKHSVQYVNHLFIFKSPYGQLYNEINKFLSDDQQKYFQSNKDPTRFMTLRKFITKVDSITKLKHLSKINYLTSSKLVISTRLLVDQNYNQFIANFSEILDLQGKHKRQNSFFKNSEVIMYALYDIDILQIKSILEQTYIDLININYKIKNQIMNAYISGNYMQVLNLFLAYESKLDLFVQPHDIFAIYTDSYTRHYQSVGSNKNTLFDTYKTPLEHIQLDSTNIFVHSVQCREYYNFLNPLNLHDISGDEKSFRENLRKSITKVPEWYKHRDLTTAMDYLMNILPEKRENKYIIDNFPITITFLSNIRSFLLQFQSSDINIYELKRIRRSYAKIQNYILSSDENIPDYAIWKSDTINLVDEFAKHISYLDKCIDELEQIDSINTSILPEVIVTEKSSDTIVKNTAVQKTLDVVKELVEQAARNYNLNWINPNSRFEIVQIEQGFRLNIELGFSDDRLTTTSNLSNYGLGEYDFYNPSAYDLVAKLISQIDSVISSNLKEYKNLDYVFIGSSDAIPFKRKLNTFMIYQKYPLIGFNTIKSIDGSSLNFHSAIINKSTNNEVLAYMRAIVFKDKLFKIAPPNNYEILVQVANKKGGAYRKVTTIVTYNIG